MKTEKIGRRGYLLTFDEVYLTNIYIIQGDEHTFLLDTYLGPEAMVLVKKELEERGLGELPLVIFNSHADYDHHWGNCAFEGSTIISHTKCRKRIFNETEQALIDHEEEKSGVVIMKLPNFTFSKGVSFPDEDIHFFHSPGHTLDSASCYDAKDKVLFVGDNVESPFPYLNNVNFEQYIHTLEEYLRYDWTAMIAGHDPIMTNTNLVRRNLTYLLSFLNWDFDLESMDELELHRHVEHNLVALKDELMKGNHRDDIIRSLKKASDLLS